MMYRKHNSEALWLWVYDFPAWLEEQRRIARLTAKEASQIEPMVKDRLASMAKGATFNTVAAASAVYLVDCTYGERGKVLTRSIVEQWDGSTFVPVQVAA